MARHKITMDGLLRLHGTMKEALPKGFYFRESDHSYFMDGERMTGVTTILGTIAKPALIGWAARMACEFISEHSPRVDDHVIPHWQVSDMVLAEAKNAHTKKKEAGAMAGTDTHTLAEEYIKDMIAHGGTAEFGTKPDWKPIEPFMQWAIKENIRFIASEQRLYSKQMFVAGTADFIFEKDGKRYIGDIKTYKKLWDRVPMLQCAGYGIMYREMNGKDIDGYCVFNLPKERSFKENEDVRWSYDVAGDQEGFLAALSLYRVLANWN